MVHGHHQNYITIISSYVDKTVSIVFESRWPDLVQNDANNQELRESVS